MSYGAFCACVLWFGIGMLTLQVIYVFSVWQIVSALEIDAVSFGNESNENHAREY
jgi:hypothetical protein